jgi:hypothetical protein
MADLQKFNYDPNKPVEGQLSTFLNGRPAGGTWGDWSFNNSSLWNPVSNGPDESGTSKIDSYQSKDPRLTFGGIGADGGGALLDGKYVAAPYRPEQGKVDNVWDLNNLYYDPQGGLVTDPRNLRDPNAKNSALIDMAIMSMVGGAGFGAAGAANAASGGATFMGQGIPRLASTGLNAVRSADSVYNQDPSSLPGLSNLANKGGSVNYDPNDPSTWSQPAGGNSGSPTGGLGNMPSGSDGSSSGGSSGGFDINGILGGLGLGNLGLGDLGRLGMEGYANNRNNQQATNDINRLVGIGTGGVTADDRSGARGLVRGIYDGSINPSQMFDRVPGLRALSDRGAADIGRQMAAHGDSDPQSSARMREFVNFNNDLTSKAYDSEMNRAMSVGGYNINPAYSANGGMSALARINDNKRNDLAGLVNSLRQGNSGGSSGSNGGILGMLSKIFGGSNGGSAGGAGALGILGQIFNSGNMPDGGLGSSFDPQLQPDENFNIDSNTLPGMDYNFQDPNSYPDFSMIGDYF